MKDIENSKKEAPFIGLTGMGGGVGSLMWAGAAGLFMNNRAFSWGSNEDPYGNLGQNQPNNTQILSPKQIGSDAVWTNVGKVGEQNTSAIKNDGTLWVWGRNEYGNFGRNNAGNYNNPAAGPRSSPVQVGTDTDWQITVINYGPGGTSSADEIVAHNSTITNQHTTYALKQNGTLWAWGSQTNGEMGLNIAGNSPNKRRSSPTQIGSGSDWTNVYTDRCRHVVATKNNGTMWSWGHNDYGSLGINGYSDRSSPCQVVGTGWKKADMNNGNWMIGLKENGTLYSWGRNEFGTLGQNENPSSVSQSPSPVQIGTDTDWVDVCCTTGCNIAIRSNGTMWSWGSNANGTLGHNETPGEGVKYSSPTQIGTGTNWTRCWANYQSVFALTSPGQMYGWGNNEQGQLGQGGTSDKKQPTTIGGSGSNVVDVGGGPYQTYWLRK